MNELLFLSFAVLVCTLNLVAFRMGKMYLFIAIVVYTLMMNIFVLKQFTLFGFMTAGGNAMYGAIFLATDMLTEHYGKREAQKSIAIGFSVMLFFVIATQVLLAFIPNEFDFANESLKNLFTLAPRILFGSLTAYIIAQFLDITIYQKIRDWTNNKYLWLRNNLSTMVSQLVDTIVFTAVGMTAFSWLPFEGIFQPSQFWEVVAISYIIKIIVALLDTPFLYLSYKFLPKELEHSPLHQTAGLRYFIRKIFAKLFKKD